MHERCIVFQLEVDIEDTRGGNQRSYIVEGQTLQYPKEWGKTMIYQTLENTLKTEQRESH